MKLVVPASRLGRGEQLRSGMLLVTILTHADTRAAQGPA
jgi:hypothetical protein